MAQDVIFTCQEDAGELCLNEIFSAAPAARFVRWLDGGTGIVRAPEDFSSFAAVAEGKGLIFPRHLFPLEFILEQREGSWPLSDLLADLTTRLDKNIPFAVQIRRAGTAGTGLGDTARFLSDGLEQAGFLRCDKAPRQIVSLLVQDTVLYGGVSSARQNRSAWPGGMRHYARRENQISRAEYKLMEALECFGVELPRGGNALDLGAAPGGWTKVLLEAGLFVTAVDPASLSPALAQNPRVRHYKGLAQDFAATCDERFDLLVNDMKMDVPVSVSVMLAMSGQLSPSGFLIMTFKLPQKKRTAIIQRGLSMLKEEYTGVQARQLFHNRSEITIFARKK